MRLLIAACCLLALSASRAEAYGDGSWYSRGGGGVVYRFHDRAQVHRHHAHDRVHALDRGVALANGFPAPLLTKVREIVKDCRGFHVVSGYRPGARIAGSGRVSLHALHRAIDIAGPNYHCAYARLRGWPGGVSIDAWRMHHIHLSWAPGSHEWHARFNHGGGTRVASRYRHRVVVMWRPSYTH
jgi:hypothetical protein